MAPSPADALHAALDRGSPGACARLSADLLAAGQVAAVLSFVVHRALVRGELTACRLLVHRARRAVSLLGTAGSGDAALCAREAVAVMLHRHATAPPRDPPPTSYVPPGSRPAGLLPPADDNSDGNNIGFVVDLPPTPRAGVQAALALLLGSRAPSPRARRDALLSHAWDVCEWARTDRDANLALAREAWRALFRAAEVALLAEAGRRDVRRETAHVRDLLALSMHRFTRATPAQRFEALAWCLDLRLGGTRVEGPPPLSAMAGIVRWVLPRPPDHGHAAARADGPPACRHLYTVPPPPPKTGGTTGSAKGSRQRTSRAEVIGETVQCGGGRGPCTKVVRVTTHRPPAPGSATRRRISREAPRPAPPPS